MADRNGSNRRRVVASFDDRAKAEQASSAAAEASGARDAGVDRRDDEVASLEGTMREELDASLVGPGADPPPKGLSKGALTGTALAGLLGALIALPLAFLPMPGDLPLAAKLAIAAVVGGVGGSTIGVILGAVAGHAAAEHDEVSRPERGSVVGVTVDEDGADGVAETLRRQGASRVDEVSGDGQPRRRLR